MAIIKTRFMISSSSDLDPHRNLVESTQIIIGVFEVIMLYIQGCLYRFWALSQGHKPLIMIGLINNTMGQIDRQNL